MRMSVLANYGIMVEPQLGLDLRETISLMESAEKMGYGYVFRSDHLLSTSKFQPEDSAECWTSLGAVASRTNRIRFGPLVSPVGFRNPALLAQMVCILHRYSGGRLQLGVGAGWFKDEYDAYGFQFLPFKRRLAQFEEALKLMVPLLRGESVDHEGPFFRVHTECFPKPNSRVHLIVGGRNPRTVGLAAQYADEWNVFSPQLSQFRSLRQTLLSNAGGRKVETSIMSGFVLAESLAQLRRTVRRQMRVFGIAGDPDKTLATLKRTGTFAGQLRDFASQVGNSLDEGVDRIYFQVLEPRDKVSMKLLAETLRSRL